jgi:hypothetical protein
MPEKQLFQFNYDYLGHEMPRSEVGLPKLKLLEPYVPPYMNNKSNGYPFTKTSGSVLGDNHLSIYNKLGYFLVRCCLQRRVATHRA